jgi:hypothetical protein
MHKRVSERSKRNAIIKTLDVFLYIAIVGISACVAILLEHAQQFGSGVISIIAGYPISFETLIKYAKEEYGVVVIIAFFLIVLLGIGLYFLQSAKEKRQSDLADSIDKLTEKLNRMYPEENNIKNGTNENEQRNQEKAKKNS